MRTRVLTELHRTRGNIQSSPTFPLSIDELADRAGMSAGHFCRSFRMEFGLSPHQFMTEVRLERAKEKLRKGSDPLIEISLDLGFCHQSHFTSWFKKLAGMTPNAYRRSISLSGRSAM